MKKTLLFVTYGGGHAHMIYPVVRSIRESTAYKRGELDIQVMGLTAAQPILRNNAVECFGYSEFINTETDAQALELGKKMAKKHHSPTVGVTLDESAAYLGLNYNDLILQHGEEKAAALYEEKQRNSFYPIHFMQRVMDKICPDMVIATNSPRSEAAAIAAAKERGIPTLVIADLFTGIGDYHITADHMAFPCALAADMFVQDGLVDPAKTTFHITGNPAFDKLLDYTKTPDPKWMPSHFPEIALKKTVLHVEMPGYWDTKNSCSYIKTEQDVIEEMEACYQACLANDVAYLVRPHPSQDRQFFVDWVKDKPNATFAGLCDLHELLRNTDLVIARTSTVAVESLYMHKKIIQLDADFHSDIPLASLELAWGINTYSELEDCIGEALSNHEKQKSILEHIKAAFPQQPASPQIASIVREQLRIT